MQSASPSPIQTVLACPASMGLCGRLSALCPLASFAVRVLCLAHRAPSPHPMQCTWEHAVHRQQTACCLYVVSAAFLGKKLPAKVLVGVRACFEQ